MRDQQILLGTPQLLLLCLLLTGCSAKKHESPKPKATLTNCVQVSIDAKTNRITVVCPLPEGKK